LSGQASPIQKRVARPLRITDQPPVGAGRPTPDCEQRRHCFGVGAPSGYL